MDERNATPALRRAKRVEFLDSTFMEKPRCQTSKSRVRSAALRSHLQNANRSITRNVILLIQNAVSRAAMRGGPTSAVAEEHNQVVNANDSRSRATNAARLIPCPSSLRRAGRFCAATVLARIAQRNGPEMSRCRPGGLRRHLA